ncbi:MAG: two-component system sensor histidine kinase KdbD, partial [Thiomonas sp. 14-66-4]
LPSAALFYLPLKAPMRVRGVLVVDPGDTRLSTIPELRRLLETCATQIAIALERIHFVSVAQDTLLAMQAERMRNSLLSTLSHDLRTPLTSLVGAAEVLASQLAAQCATPCATQATASAASLHAQALIIMRQARRLAHMVDDLLDMARLQSGQVTLRHDWQSVEELVGSALRAVDPAQLAQHPLHIDLPADFPLVRADAVLLERVLVNLLDNALKFTPPGTPLGVRAQVQGAEALLTVWDQGPGLPHGRERAVFEKFTRGEPESSIPGVGLGLAICRVIVEAHGGTIAAANQPMGGAAFSVRLPLQTAPQLEPAGDAEREAETGKSPAAATVDPAAHALEPTAAPPTSPELP